MIANYYHLSGVRMLRSFARKIGILNLLKSSLFKRQKSYEEAFHIALKNAVGPGDTVWDVGANVGLYTKFFLEWSGPSGKVVAFESLPEAFAALTKEIDDHRFKKNAVLECIALADKPGEAVFLGNFETNSVTTTAHIIDSDKQSESGITVKVSTADIEVFNKGLQSPNVVKIDVEGF